MSLRSFTDEELSKAVKESISYTSVIEKLGLHICGGNQQSIRKHVLRLGLDTSHFLGMGWNVGNKFGLKNNLKRELCSLLVENSPCTNANLLKKRLIKEGLFVHKCYRCGRTEWEGVEIPIQLDHINGVHSDNRIDNLTILCPNCHALTNTYCGKNIKNRNKKFQEINSEAKRKRNEGKLSSLQKKLIKYREEREERNRKLTDLFKGKNKLDKNTIIKAMEMFGLTSRSGIRYLYNKYRFS